LDLQFTRPYSHPDDDQTLTSWATIQSVFPDYLAVTGVQLKTGRDFTVDDLVGNRRVAIVDERIARQLWPNGALGQPLLLGQGGPPAIFEIVGVTSPVRALSARDASTPHIFVPFEQFNLNMALVVATSASVSALGITIKQVVEALGTRRPVFDIQPMRFYVDRSLAEMQFTMLVMVGFAVAALVMVAVGVYGTLTYLTAQRRQEFAVRLALGASGPTILRGVIGEALVLTGMGAIAGLLGSVATSSVLRHQLYDLPAIHWPTLVAVATLVGSIAVVATAQPAWRASRIDPARVLRTQ
jgi:putative ABC transport system permease protein